MQTTWQSVIKVAALGFLALQISACGGEKESPGLDAGREWPRGYSVPVPGTTFPLSPQYLPGAERHKGIGASRGFEFSDGFVGRPLGPNPTVVAVAAGTVVRVDRAFAPLEAGEREFLSSRAGGSGPIANLALDRLHGRQVWIEHEGGYVSRYARLSEVDPKLRSGDSVRQGQPIGLMGNTGGLFTDALPTSAPRLHFEMWLPDGIGYLGQDMTPLESHSIVAAVFSEDALPRYAQRVVSQIEAGQESPDVYPPDELPRVEFQVDPPPTVPAGNGFAIPITWNDAELSVQDFFATLENLPLGLIDAGNGAWILGAMPLQSSGKTLTLSVGAVDIFGRTITGQSRLTATRPMLANEVREVEPAVLELYSAENQRLEAARLAPVHEQSSSLREPLWRAPFQPPVAGNIVATFGQLAVHGIRRPEYPLPGIEIVPDGEDAEIGAANAGIVALIDELPIRGKTVALVHGGGVVTIYSQVGNVEVSVGEQVDRGQPLASVAADAPRAPVRVEIHVAGIPSNPVGWLNKMLPVAEVDASK